MPESHLTSEPPAEDFPPNPVTPTHGEPPVQTNTPEPTQAPPAAAPEPPAQPDEPQRRHAPFPPMISENPRHAPRDNWNPAPVPPPLGFGMSPQIHDVVNKLDTVQHQFFVLSHERQVLPIGQAQPAPGARTDDPRPDDSLFGGLGDRPGGVREKVARAEARFHDGLTQAWEFSWRLRNAVDESRRATEEQQQNAYFHMKREAYTEPTQ